MRYSSISAYAAAAILAAAIAAPALAQSGAPISGNAPPREPSSDASSHPQSIKDKPTTSGGMSLHEATGGRLGSPKPGTAAAPASDRTDRMSSGAATRSEGRALGETSARSAGSDQVKSVQRALNDKGANLQVDGKMGPRTRAALREFQQKNGLQATGNLDSETRAKLGAS